jgi:uncharacterized protein DUF6932
MLPDFDEHGNLPAGIQFSSIEEVRERFENGSPEREVETKELAELIEWAKAAGVRRLIVDGSCVTAKVSPNDVDVVILPGPQTIPTGQSAVEMAKRWPFVHLIVATDEADFERWALHDFGIDRDQRLRGVVEIRL